MILLNIICLCPYPAAVSVSGKRGVLTRLLNNLSTHYGLTSNKPISAPLTLLLSVNLPVPGSTPNTVVRDQKFTPVK